MPAPTNITPATATALVDGVTVTQRVDDGAATATVYYKFTNTSDDDQVFSFWAYNEDFPSDSGYRPQVTIYEGAGADNYLTFGSPMGAFTLPILAGQTFVFEIYEDHGDDVVPSNLTIQFQIETRFDAPGVLAPGRVLIPSASTDSTFVDVGIAGLDAGLIDAEASAIVGFVPVLCTGEMGDVFPTTGRIVLGAEAGETGDPSPLDYFINIYDGTTFALLTQTAIASSQTPPDGRMHLPTERLYMLRHMGGGATFLCHLTASGTLTELHQIVGLAGAANTLAISDAANLAYISMGFPQGPIVRWDIETQTLLGTWVAQVNEHYVTDLLVLSNGHIIASYFRPSTFFGGANQAFVRAFDIDGSTIWTYTPTFPAALTSTPVRLGYSADEARCWFFAHLVTGRSAIRAIATDDGAELIASLTPDVIETDDENGDQEIPYTSDSCPILELRAAPTGSEDSDLPPDLGTIVVTKAALSASDEVSDPPVFTFTMSPVDAFDPATFTLSPGESMTFEDVEPGRGYGVTEAALEGWDLESTVVSNGSPSVNLSVDAGETVEVTFTNTPDVCECCVSTRLEITNFALAKLGQTRFITSLDEATAEGYTAAQLWDLALRASLRHFPWAFATKYAGGSDPEDGYMNLIDGSTSDYAVENEWVYAYRYPLDCLFARRIVPPTGEGRTYNRTPITFRVGRTWNGTNDVPLIYCNQVEAVLEYTALVECSEDFFDALFEDFLSWRLAGLMAPGLTRTAKTATECYQMAMLLLDQSRAVASQEQQQDKPGIAEWHQDR